MSKKVILILGLFLLVIISVWLFIRPVFNFSETKIPRDLITSQFIDLSRVYAISKFRSGSGHDYSYGSWDGETCRSMKHYFNAGRNVDASGHPVRSLPAQGDPNIKIYAPFDGRIIDVSSEHIGTQIRIRSSAYPSYSARIFHIDLRPGFHWGSAVKSGQWIGTIGPKDGTDFAVEANTLTKTILLSYFETMTDEVFKPFSAMGYRRDDFIVSKKYRDAHPFKCGGTDPITGKSSQEAFNHPQNYNWTEDFIFLKPDPYPENMGPGARTIQIGPPIR